VAHLVEKGAEGADDPRTVFDEELTRLLRTRWTRPYDLVSGLVGFGVYALERVPGPSSKGLLARVVRHLGMIARRRRPGVAWRSNPRWVPTNLRMNPNPDWNLGVAHGVPGVVALLGHVVAADVDAQTRDTARALLGVAAGARW